WSNVWRLLTTQCPANSVIQASASNQTTCTNGNWTFRFNQLAAGTYYLPVPNVGFGQGGGAYSIDVSAMPCSNDLCSDISPVPLPIGSMLTFIGDNTTATFAGDAVPGSLLDQFPFADTWHAFTTTQCTNVTVSYCATDSGWSNVWRLLTTQCPADSVIPASTSDQVTCANGNWTFSFNQLAPGTYYLPVPNVGFGQGGGAYSIDVSAESCGNDHCEDITPQALALGGTLTFTGDNTNATFPGDAAPGSLLDQFPFADTWHAFTTTQCANITVSYCATDSGWSNVWKLLTQVCPADAVINATLAEQTTCANGNWTFNFNELPAGTYYLPVPNVGFGQGGGPYSITVNATNCSNDLCGNITAVSLPVGGTLTFTGDNTNATFPGDAVPGSFLDQFPFPDTWHAFTTTECSDITASYCATASGWSNVWRLLTTECPAGSVIGASSADTVNCPNGNWTFSFHQLQPGTYYLPVPNVGFGQGGGAYNIAVVSTACLPDHVQDLNSRTEWSVFPNPTTGEVTILSPREMGMVTVDLIDMTGRTMFSTQLVFNANARHQLPLSGIAPGTYALRISTTNGRSSQLLIVK
ncbi:MAG: T9SS type A sorting domain-containing protein, partial [Flavobacteriales bacterium]